MRCGVNVETGRGVAAALMLLMASLACGAPPEDGRVGGTSATGGKPRGVVPPVSARKPVAASGGAVLVLVAGEAITERDLERMFDSRRVPATLRAAARKPFLEEMVEARLIGQFLAEKRLVAPEKELAAQIERLKYLAAREGGDAELALEKAGYTAESLRAELALPLAWQAYVEESVSAEKLATYFEQHRAEFDGTEVRARQIVLKLPKDAPEEDVSRAMSRLRVIREEIAAGRVEFSEAAKRDSQAASGREGGDLGFFPYRGTMPEAITRVAFGLNEGELSEPFRTPFGVHLLQTVERKPGDLVLEDVRREVLGAVSQQVWKQTVAARKKTALIEWKTPAGSNTGKSAGGKG